MTHKEMWIAKHDDLISEYMESHPEATEKQAQDATAQLVDEAVQDYYDGLGDYQYEQMKDRKMEEENDK